MNKKDMQILMEQYYKFIGINSSKKRIRIINLLSYCKEVRDTAYPMKNSKVTELHLKEFVARKEKDLIYVTGSLLLSDREMEENRSFEGYIIEDKEEGKTRIYLDIIRLSVMDEPKMIRTSEVIIEDEKNIMEITAYASTDATEEKMYSTEFPKNPSDDYIIRKKVQQLSVL